MLSWSDIYKEILQIRLGPYGQQLWKGGSFSSYIDAFRQIGKLGKDNLLYGRKVWLGAERPDGKVWLLVGTKNNVDTLRFFKENLEHTIWVATNKKTVPLTGEGRISLHYALWYWYKKPALLLGLWPHFGWMLWRKPDEWAFALGQYEAAIGVLRKHRPKALIFANDHVPEMRAFLWAAIKENIPTVYIQHASVSTYFPPLRYDLSLLEGQDALDKYKKCGPIQGKVELVGMPKFDAYQKSRNFKRTIENIGVCGTFVDQQDRIETLLWELSKALPDLHITFRAHPRDDRYFNLPDSVALSNAKQESIFEFLQKQDVLIAGDTSTHLEAVLLNVNALYFPFNDQLSDYYGFRQTGLVETPENFATLVEWIRAHLGDRPEVYQKAAYYNAVVGTPQEGRSSELALEAVREVVRGQ